MSASDATDKKNANYAKVPWIFSLGAAILWALIFWFLGRLHGMWRMYEGEFPLIIASLLGITKTNLSATQALLLAALDGAGAGWLSGWLFRFFLKHLSSGRGKSATGASGEASSNKVKKGY